jgi:hypothetical protein
MNKNMYSDGNKIGHRVRLYRHFQQYIDYTRLNGRRKKGRGVEHKYTKLTNVTLAMGRSMEAELIGDRLFRDGGREEIPFRYIRCLSGNINT